MGHKFIKSDNNLAISSIAQRGFCKLKNIRKKKFVLMSFAQCRVVGIRRENPQHSRVGFGYCTLLSIIRLRSYAASLRLYLPLDVRRHTQNSAMHRDLPELHLFILFIFLFPYHKRMIVWKNFFSFLLAAAYLYT